MLVAFGVFVICWLLLQGYKNTFGLLLGKIAELTADVHLGPFHPFGWLASGIKELNDFILNQLGQVVIGSAQIWHKMVGQLAAFIHTSMRLTAELAEATESAFTHIQGYVIPRAITAAFGPLADLVYVLRRQLAALEAKLAAIPHVIEHTVTRVVQPEITKVTKVTRIAVQSAPIVVAGELGIPAGRFGHLERDVKGVRDALRGLLRRVTPAALLGASVAAVASLGLTWTRCSGSQRFGRQLCGMDQDLLGSLIADTLLVLGTVSLVEFAQGMQTVTAEGAKEIQTFWRA